MLNELNALGVSLRLELEELDVPARLLLRADPALQVAVVADADRRRFESRRQIGRHSFGLLLVDASDEPVFGPVAEETQREMGDRRSCVLAAGVVRLDQVEPFAPGAAEELADLGCVFGDEVLVGVEVEEPVAGGGVEAGVAGV